MPCGVNKLEKGDILKFKKMTAIQILGLAAGTITSITFLPQVIHIWKTKSAKDLSLQMLLLLVLGVTMWLAYGILIKDAAIIYTNSMVLIMSLILVYFKFKFNK
jgi:MtN3 and saliva related transmembrane protein